MRTWLLALLLPHLAAPATLTPPQQQANAPVPVQVTVTDIDGTTEPSGKPALRARPARAGTIRLSVLGRGELCHSQWAATRTGDAIALVATPPPNVAAFGTCSLTLVLSPVPAGTFRVTLEGESVTARSQ
jgi:hypothetical protein